MKTEMKPSRQPPSVFQPSRRLRRPRSGDGERVRALLNRLQTIVPAAPKDRQLPQVQVIQHVINYICQLQHQVVRHPRLGKMVTAAGKAEEKATARLEDVRSEEKQAEGEEMEVSAESRAPTSETEESLKVCSDTQSAPPSDSDGESPL